MSVLIESEPTEPALLAVAKVVAEAAADASLQTLPASPDLLGRLLEKDLLALLPEKDAEAAYLVLSHAAGKLACEASLPLISSLVRTVAASAAPPAARLRVLFAAFNCVPHSRCRFALLLRALQLAAAEAHAEGVAHLLRHADAWAADWQLAPAELRSLRLAAYELLEKAGSPYAALLSYLSLFEGESPAALAAVADLAAAAARAFIAAPQAFQSELLDLAAVRALEGHAVHGPLFQLLTLFLTGTLADYSAFLAAQGGQPPAGLVHEECVAKIRLLSLASLQAAGGEASYSQVQAALAVGEEEVEAWVVRAIGAGVLEAKMDQVGRKVVITRGLQRVFGPPQWAELAARLGAWKESVGSLLEASSAMLASGGVVA